MPFIIINNISSRFYDDKDYFVAYKEGKQMEKPENTVQQWRNVLCEENMRAMGMHDGDKVIDFGSGRGNYTIPAAKVVGPSGCVYAVDRSHYVLEEIKTKTKEMGLYQIITVYPKRDDKLEFADGTIDFLMIYDLIHALGTDMEPIINESYRVLKNKGILSILPFHMSSEKIFRIQKVIEKRGFELAVIRKQAGVHFEMNSWLGRNSDDLSNYELGDIYNFRKEK